MRIRLRVAYASNVKRRASSVERRASSVERRASSVERRASSVERRASSVERRASSDKRRVIPYIAERSAFSSNFDRAASWQHCRTILYIIIIIISLFYNQHF